MSIRVVIAEDDPQIVEIQRRYLSRIDGYELVGVAQSIVEVEDLIEVLQPDLLLLDVYFPDGTGLDVLHDLRKRHNRTDIILITAAKDVDTLREAMHGGVFYFLIKPLVFERLQSVLNDYKAHVETLHQLDQIGQKDIDNLFKQSAGAATDLTERRLPKGIDAITLDKIRQAFSDHAGQPFSAEEMAQIISASRTTARRYLEYLTSTHELTAEVNYGSVGRPERYYTQS